jgi:hypothetical protein
VSRSTKIKISIPENFTKTSMEDQEEYLFKYLKNIGFSKQNFRYPIEINEHDEALWEFQIDQLPEIQEEIELDKLLGAYYLIHRVKLGVLSYGKLCEIILEARGGLSVYYFKQTIPRSEALDFRDNLKDWIDMVLEEPKEDLDIEVRRAEYRQYVIALSKLSKKIDKHTTTYVSLTRPGSPIRNDLSLVEKKLTRIQNEQITTK